MVANEVVLLICCVKHFRGGPKMGVALNDPLFWGIFHYKPSSYWSTPHLWNPPYPVAFEKGYVIYGPCGPQRYGQWPCNRNRLT